MIDGVGNVGQLAHGQVAGEHSHHLAISVMKRNGVGGHQSIGAILVGIGLTPVALVVLDSNGVPLELGVVILEHLGPDDVVLTIDIRSIETALFGVIVGYEGHCRAQQFRVLPHHVSQ